jgi:ketosteroid isomerase-like protein
VFVEAADDLLAVLCFPKGCDVRERAYSHGTYAFTMTSRREGGDTLEISGKFLTILEKQVDGSWKIAIDRFNYDASPG